MLHITIFVVQDINIMNPYLNTFYNLNHWYKSANYSFKAKPANHAPGAQSNYPTSEKNQSVFERETRYFLKKSSVQSTLIYRIIKASKEGGSQLNAYW